MPLFSPTIYTSTHSFEPIYTKSFFKWVKLRFYGHAVWEENVNRLICTLHCSLFNAIKANNTTELVHKLNCWRPVAISNWCEKSVLLASDTFLPRTVLNMLGNLWMVMIIMFSAFVWMPLYLKKWRKQSILKGCHLKKTSEHNVTIKVKTHIIDWIYQNAIWCHI